MKELSYRTRGDSSPQGKQRVYFACHPDDFKACFDPICEDIFKTQNCAIYYDPHADEPWDEKDMEVTLSEMQLFVIPITYNFLYVENVARTVELPFATKKKIAVLPLMQESGLGDEFNRICGDLQYLDKETNLNDPTAIPYDEKLEKFLASVLVGDEMANKVRAAFDAYIFLSYRKKDRQYAQDLMRLIHKNDFCRDIAIWYDEFLIPGDNFNDAIQAAMDKSDLFTFVVTPNLLEPGNYVMREEYPRAKESQKPLLSAEMEPTDHAKLQENFIGMEPMDANDSPALSSELKGKLRDIAITENDNDPEHNFFIGLAYLSGIDVEQDRERAAGLITGAADAGLPEAMDRLAQMYKYGDGVDRDYEKSAQWLEKLADYWENRYDDDESQESGDKLIETLQNAGDAWYDLLRVKQARRLYEKMMSASNELLMQNKDIKYIRNIADSYIKMEHVNASEGNLSDTREYFLKNKELCEMLANGTKTPESYRMLSRSYVQIGYICYREGDLREARHWCSEGLELMKSLDKEEDTPESRYDLFRIYIWLANNRINDNYPTGEYHSAMKIIEELAEEMDTVQYRMDLANCYNKFGDYYQGINNDFGASVYYKKGCEQLKGLAERTNTLKFRQYLSDNYCGMGYVCQAEGKLAEAMNWYLKSLRIAKRMARETDSASPHRILCRTYRKLGELCRSGGKLAPAKRYYTRCVEQNALLTDETDENRSRRRLATCCERLGYICKAEGNLQDAKNWYHKGLKQREELSKEYSTVKYRQSRSLRKAQSEEPGDAKSCPDLSRNFDSARCICRNSRHNAEMEVYYHKIFERKKAYESKRCVIMDCYRIGDICISEERFSNAKGWYIKGQELNCELTEEAEKDDTIQCRQDLTYGYSKLGYACEKEGNLLEAKNWYLKRLKQDEIIAENKGTVKSCKNLLWTCNKLGDICKADGDTLAAEDYYRKKDELRDTLNEKSKTIKNSLMQDKPRLNMLLLDKPTESAESVLNSEIDREWKGLLREYNKLGGICGPYGNLEKAKENLEEANKNRRNWCVVSMEDMVFPKNGGYNAETLSLLQYIKQTAADSEKEGDMEKARDAHLSAIAMYNHILKKMGRTDSRMVSSLCSSCEKYGDFYKREGNLQESRKWYMAVVEMIELMRSSTDIAQTNWDLHHIYNRLGALCETEGNLAEAKDWYIKGMELDEALAESLEALGFRQNLSYDYERIGELCESTSDLAEAKKFYLKSKKLNEMLAEETKSIESYCNLSISYERLGWVCEADGNLAEAKNWFQKGIELNDRLSVEEWTGTSYNNLAAFCFYLGILERDHPDIGLLKRAEEIWSFLSEVLPQEYTQYLNNVRKEIAIAENRGT